MEQDIHFIHREVDSLSWHLNRARGVLDRLDGEIKHGRFLHPETSEAIDLLNDANALRKIADDMLRRRNQLIANMPKVQLEAAE